MPTPHLQAQGPFSNKPSLFLLQGLRTVTSPYATVLCGLLMLVSSRNSDFSLNITSLIQITHPIVLLHCRTLHLCIVLIMIWLLLLLFLLWKLKVKVVQLCPTLCNPMDYKSPWNSPGQSTGVGSLSLLQWIFPTQGSNPGLPPCRWILYQLSHKGSPRTLEWVAYAFASRSSWPRNQTGVSCIAGRFLTVEPQSTCVQVH